MSWCVIFHVTCSGGGGGSNPRSTYVFKIQSIIKTERERVCVCTTMQQPQKHSYLLPFHYIPTESLVACQTRPVVVSSETTVASTSFSQLISRELDETSGMAILDYIYKKKNRGSVLSGGGGGGEKKTKHTNGFVLPKSSGGGGFLSEVADYWGYPTQENIKKINIDVLVENKITIRTLLRKCHVSPTDLKPCGILNNLDDLWKLQFVPKDLVREREIFNVNTAYAAFSVGYESLLKHGHEFTGSLLLDCRFLVGELQVLGFSFDRTIQKGYINKEELALLQYGLKDLRELGFSCQHLRKLAISERDAIEKFKWKRSHYQQFLLQQQ
jgi:hypothetical protein